MKAPHKIGIPPGLRVLCVERHEAHTNVLIAAWDVSSETKPTRTRHYRAIVVEGHYRLWLHTNDRVLGTYLALWDNGKIERITVRDNEGDQIDLIKPAD